MGLNPRLTDEESQLVADYYRLALYHASRFAAFRQQNFDYFLDAATDGLLQAARTYCREPREGAEFKPLANSCIRWRLHESDGKLKKIKGLFCRVDLPSTFSDPRSGEDIAKLEAREEAERILATMPPKHARALELVKLEGLSQREAGHVMGTCQTEVSRLVSDSMGMLGPMA